MLVSKVFSRISRSVLNHCRGLLVSPRQEHIPFLFNNFHSLHDSTNQWVPSQVTFLRHSILNTSAFQRFGFASSASPQSTEKESNQSRAEHGATVEQNHASSNDDPIKTSEDVKAQEKTEDTGSTSEPKTSPSRTGKRRMRGTKKAAFSDSDSEGDLSINDLVKLVTEKEELLKIKHKEIEIMQDKVLRSYAEMENVMERTRREAENVKKFAIQNFAKSLLDVADNLARASSVVKESFSKIDASKDTTGAVSLLKTLLDGVEMTEKQLLEVFAKFGVKKFDPMNEQFDPHRHNAVFQIPDPSKPPGTVAAVLKAGYMLHDRVIRPADVGVTVALDNNEAEHDSGA